MLDIDPKLVGRKEDVESDKFKLSPDEQKRLIEGYIRDSKEGEGKKKKHGFVTIWKEVKWSKEAENIFEKNKDKTPFKEGVIRDISRYLGHHIGEL